MRVNVLLSALQALGLLAVVVGVWLLLPLAPALIAVGVLVLVAATAVEFLAARAGGK